MKLISQILLIPFLLLFTTCKKYPEGGLVSLTYKHLFGGSHKEIQKTWELQSYIVNGIDSTVLIAGAKEIPDFKKKFADFVIQDWRLKDFIVYTFLYTIGIELDKKGKTLSFTSSLNSYYSQNDSSQCFTKNNILYCERNIFNPEYNKNTTWNISKLTKRKLELKTTLTNDYKIILVNNDF